MGVGDMKNIAKFFFLAFLQFLLPGLGHCLIGKVKTGLIFILIFAFSFVAYLFSLNPFLPALWWILPLISIVHLLTYFISFKPGVN